MREVSRTEDGKQGSLKVLLKYDEGRRPAISEIRRQSKPGLSPIVQHSPHISIAMSFAPISWRIVPAPRARAISSSVATTTG